VATFGWGLGFYGQSVYLAELHRLHGWPTSLISSATTFFYLFGALVVAFISEAIRGLGPRNCMMAGVCVMAGATALLGQITSPWQLYAVSALLALGWAGTSLGMITNTLGLWFDTRRGMAISLALNGASCGGVVGVPLLVAAIGHFGFSGAVTTATLVMIALLVPVIFLVVGHPPDRERIAAMPAAASANDPSSLQIRSMAFRDVAFLTLTIAFALVLFAQVGFIVHLISFLDPVIGRERAAVAVALLLPARADLGRWLKHAARDRIELTGMSDHRVSEALYLRDPDQNGVELYRDRPQDEWPRDANGGLAMFTRRLDLDDLMRQREG
jgi:MFS family permease